jgi:hypothetical protein
MFTTLWSTLVKLACLRTNNGFFLTNCKNSIKHISVNNDWVCFTVLQQKYDNLLVKTQLPAGIRARDLIFLYAAEKCKDKAGLSKQTPAAMGLN